MHITMLPAVTSASERAQLYNTLTAEQKEQIRDCSEGLAALSSVKSTSVPTGLRLKENQKKNSYRKNGQAILQILLCYCHRQRIRSRGDRDPD